MKTPRPIVFAETASTATKITAAARVVEKWLDDNDIRYIHKVANDEYQNYSLRNNNFEVAEYFIIKDDLIIVVDGTQEIEDRYYRRSKPSRVSLSVGYGHTFEGCKGKLISPEDSYNGTIKKDRRALQDMIHRFGKRKSCWTLSNTEGNKNKMSVSCLANLDKMIEASESYKTMKNKATVTTKVNGIKLNGYCKKLVDILRPYSVTDSKGNEHEVVVKTSNNTSANGSEIRYNYRFFYRGSDDHWDNDLIKLQVTAKLNTETMKYSFLKFDIQSCNTYVKEQARIDDVFELLKAVEKTVADAEWSAPVKLNVDMTGITNLISFPNFNSIEKNFGAFGYNVSVRPEFNNSAENPITEDDYLSLDDAGIIYSIVETIAKNIKCV